MKCSNCGETGLPVNAAFCHRCGSEILQVSSSVKGEGLLQSGSIIQNRYKIESLLGQGGWGAVYRASYVSFELGRIFGPYCALKEMKPSCDIPVSSEQLLEMFEGEAQILVQLKHEHIPRITDYFHEGGRYYLVMEFIEGKDLADLMKDNGGRPFPEEKVLQWGIEVCQVLDYLHTRKPVPFIFRDLKPANIVLDKNGKITVIDFGITRIFNPSDPNNFKLGTPGYSPPEQYRGMEDPRADIYALGVTLYYLLSGRDPAEEKPFTFQDMPLRTINPLVSRELEDIVMRAVQNDVNRRFQHSSEILELMTSLYWKSISPGDKENFEWLEATITPVSPVPPAFTRKLDLKDLEGLSKKEEEKEDKVPLKREILFAPLDKGIFENFKNGELCDYQWFDLRMKAEKLSLTTGFNRLISLGSVKVVPYTHQKKAAMDALRIMRGRVLLADEVGLGENY